MKRMKTFLFYLLLLVGFFILSILLENGLLNAMYGNISGSVDGNLVSSADGGSSNILVEVEEAKASNVNGSFKAKVTNTSGHDIDKCCAKIELLDSKGFCVATEYVDITDFKAGETRNMLVKFKAKDVASYRVSIIESAPDKSNIINLFGWEFDLSDFFGFDLTKILGDKVNILKDLFGPGKIKNGLLNIWNYFINISKSLPWWAWAIATGIVIWSIPSGYLLGIFPL